MLTHGLKFYSTTLAALPGSSSSSLSIMVFSLWLPGSGALLYLPAKHGCRCWGQTSFPGDTFLSYWSQSFSSVHLSLCLKTMGSCVQGACVHSFGCSRGFSVGRNKKVISPSLFYCGGPGMMYTQIAIYFCFMSVFTSSQDFLMCDIKQCLHVELVIH